MSDQAMLKHIKRLDRLYLAECDAFSAWIAESTAVNRRRYIFCLKRYQEAVNDGRRRFGLSSRPAKREAA